MEPQGYVKTVLERLASSTLSDAELCRRAGIAQTTIVRMKSGETSPTIRTLDKIERVLDDYETASGSPPA